MPALKIFITHKREADKYRARDLAAAMGAVGGRDVSISMSQDFQPGVSQAQLEERLKESDWLIFLYTDPSFNYDMCYYEVGFFKREQHANSRMICLHPPTAAAPELFNQTIEHVAATPTNIEKLLYDIYVREPWKVNPAFGDPESRTSREDQIRKIANAMSVAPEPPEATTYTCSIRIDILKSSLSEWHDTGTLPRDALVTGNGEWEKALGMSERTGSWTWGAIIDAVPRGSSWVPVLEEALRRAETREQGMRELYLPRRDSHGVTYRLMMHKLERLRATGELRFQLIIAPLEPPFDAKATDVFAIIHHLVALAWLFRWRIINKHTEELRDLQALRASPSRGEQGWDERLGRLVADFRADMHVIEIDSQRRGLDRVWSILDAFAVYEDAPKNEKLTEESRNEIEKLKPLMLVEWPRVQSELEDALRRGEDGLDDAARKMERASAINRFFFERATHRYWELAKSLLSLS